MRVPKKKYPMQCTPAKIEAITPRILRSGDELNYYAHTEYSDTKTAKAVNVKKAYRLDVPFAFDTEFTTSAETQHGYVWVHQTLIGNDCVIGRTMDEFKSTIDDIISLYGLGYNEDRSEFRYATCAVANLGCDISFIHKYFTVVKVFARSSTNLITLLTAEGILFRDYLSLSGAGGLKAIPKTYGTPTQKLEMDYDEIRTPSSPISDSDMAYIVNDVVILGEFQKYLEATYTDQGVKIPLTCTGVIRNSVKYKCQEWLNKDGIAKAKERFKAIEALMPKNYDEQVMAEQYLFRGGYTHGNVEYTGQIISGDINAWDYTSDYPACILQEDCFPMGPFEEYNPYEHTPAENQECFKTHCWKAIITFQSLEARTSITYDSATKLIGNYVGERYTDICEKHNITLDNGRILSGSRVTVALTDLDFEIYKLVYKWDNARIETMQIAKKGWLPTYITDIVVEAYRTKADLKARHLDDDPEYSATYQQSKAQVNGCYGMMVEKGHYEEYIYDADNLLARHVSRGDEARAKYLEDTFSKIKKQRSGSGWHVGVPKKYLSFYWGVWVTAIARNRIIKAIFRVGEEDTLYSDTDSVYFKNATAHKQVQEEWNAHAERLNERWVARYNSMHDEQLNIELVRTLGAFDDVYKRTVYRFKMLGAKRYLVDHLDNKTGERVLKQTIAGLGKKEMMKQYGSIDACLEAFKDGMRIEKCKLKPCRDNNHYGEWLTMPDGSKEWVEQDSGYGLAKVDFTLSMADDYLELIMYFNEIHRKEYL